MSNDSDQIVGYTYLTNAQYHATLFDISGNGNNIDLGRDQAYSINNNSEIVGHANGHAYYFDHTGNGNNIDLNTLIDPLSGWNLLYAYSINDKGWIVGAGENPLVENHAFLLEPVPVPVPVPSAALLSMLGLSFTSWKLRSRREL